MPTRVLLRNTLAALLFAFIPAMGLVGTVAPTPAAAANSPTIYVDGKHGSDANSGTSLASAFKTVGRGMWAVRYSGHLFVVGYNDYTYYETPTKSYWVLATANNPATIEAYGYGTSGYVRPIISGALVVNRPGSTRWYRPNASLYPDVWATSWTTPIVGYESSVNAARQERIFMDVSQPLARPVQTPTLAQLQASPASEYWNGKTLYVRLGLWSGTLADRNPNHHTIEIPNYNGLLIGTGSSYVTIAGFRVRHASMGVGVTGTANHVTVVDVDASYNYPMGFWTSSSYNTFERITGSRNTIQLLKLDDGAQHNLVDGAHGTENLGQGIKLTGANCAYNTIQNSTFSGGKNIPMWAAAYGGYVQGIDFEQGAHDNLVQKTTISGMRRGLMLYQASSAGGSLHGNRVTQTHFSGNDTAVLIWDGRYSASAGTGAVSFSRNTYDGNGKAVDVEAPTSNKTFDHETIYRTGTTADQGSSAFYLKAGLVSLTNSIVSQTAGYAFYAAPGASMSAQYTDVFGAGLGVTGGDVSWTPARQTSTYVPIRPVRILDSRNGTGLAGPFWSRGSKTLRVAGVGGIPASAVAITGNLTVTDATNAGYVALTTSPTSNPLTSTLNLPAHDTRANGFTTQLAANGTVAITYVSVSGARAQVIMDVTGYFLPGTSHATYLPVGPNRILDTRSGVGLSGRFVNAVARTFRVGGRGGVPTNALAVTGNLTVTAQSAAGYVALTPDAQNHPTTSTINVPSGDTRSGVGLSGTFTAGAARTLAVAGRGGVPARSPAITGNLTVTGQTAGGYVAVTVVASNNPSTSTLNFPLGDTRANNAAVPLAGGGSLGATYQALTGAHTQLILDVTGFFTAAGVPLVPTDWTLDPKFLSANPASSDYLSIDRTSPVYTLGSEGLPLGARWH